MPRDRVVHIEKVDLKAKPVLAIHVTTVGTVAVQIASTPAATRAAIALKAFPGNSATITIGTSETVMPGSGWPMSPGDVDSFDLDGSDATELWAISTAANQRLADAELS